MFEFCPYCGNPLTNEHLETSKVCRHFKQTDFFFKPITKSFNITEEVYCFDEKVVKSIVIPNIGEQRLRNLLLTIPGVIEVYEKKGRLRLIISQLFRLL